MADPLSIREIVFGLADGTSHRLVPRLRGVSLVPIDPKLAKADEVALGVRETLSQPKRCLTLESLPFVRVHVEDAHTKWIVADDATTHERMLEESTDGRLPMCIEGNTVSITDDPSLELIVSRIAAAVGVDGPDTLGPALTQTGQPASKRPASPKEIAYRRAHDRATQLAAQVRSIDDRMTASVVPGWLFIACGVGGIGVTMTAVTLFNPDLRIFVVPLMMLIFFGGLGAYGWRAWQEMQVRGGLQVNRAQLREERETARQEVRHLASTLRKKGLDPDEVLVRLEGEDAAAAQGPAILHRSTTSTAEVAHLDDLGRQVVVFIDAGAIAGEDYGEAVRALEPLTT